MKPLGHKQIIEHELEGFGIRLNKKPPNIYFKQKEKGGLALSVQCPQSELDKELVAVSFSILHQQQKKLELIFRKIRPESIYRKIRPESNHRKNLPQSIHRKI